MVPTAEQTGGPASDLPHRVRSAGRAVIDARAAMQLEIQLRDALIVQALDEGYKGSTVAEWAGIDRRTQDAAIARVVGERPE